VEDKTSLATEPVSPIVELPSFGSKDPRQATRQIIPVSEAMLLYDGRSTDDPSKTSNSVAKGDLDKPFFVEGLPSEEETLAFFKESSTEVSPRANPVPSTDLPAVEEDMDPTIAIPAVVPTPAVRPQTTDARVEFRIEQGDGVQSGFVLYNKDDKNLRRYFLVARAFRGGETIPWKFKDIADGKDVSTEKFAIEVSETAFRSLSEEKKKFGKVVHEVIGSAKDDKGKIDWAIESNGNMLAAPEGRS
jgi:hypothetical protein